MNKITSSMALLLMSGNVLFAGGEIIPMNPVSTTPTKEVVVVDNNVKYNGFYAGAGVNYMRLSEILTFNGYGLTLHGGYYFNKYIGVEARYMTTLSNTGIDSQRPVVYTDTTLSNIAIYAKPMYSLTPGFGIYGLAGFGQSNYSNLQGDYAEAGLQWGVGAKYELANGVGLFVDYLDIYSGENFDSLHVEDVTFSGTTVGATYTF